MIYTKTSNTDTSTAGTQQELLRTGLAGTMGKRGAMNFTENLRVLREKDGMTQEQLAERMEVSRQTISKWESGASMPELEKLVQLTELFGCTMDGLLKGNLSLDTQKESQLYDRHGNWVAKKAAAATGICIMSFAAQLVGEYINPSFFGESAVLFLVGALLGTLLWVQVGMNASHFREKHPYIEPFYTEEEKERFHQKYVSRMITAIGILICSLIVISSLYTVWNTDEERLDAYGGFIFLAMASAGVMLIVHTALLASKYHVEKYNAENAWDASEEGRANARRIGKACGGIMAGAVLVCIVLWMFRVPQMAAGVPLVIGGILCGIASIFLNKKTV
ncbi:MAG: helix-turn-helix domain-containing protein [Eubacterium sp.]|nr:helix-turn-helix domain-containing protein [Eubacterium sp.]